MPDTIISQTAFQVNAFQYSAFQVEEESFHKQEGRVLPRGVSPHISSHLARGPGYTFTKRR